ncbi:uncharacterized protein DS421_20g697300 [Arachis hypogaea]|nr:uncharacterized protein DS421_20g697300 [Arachis hypogaea]
MRSCHSAIFLVTHSRRPRVRVIRADSNPCVRVRNAFASLRFLHFARSREPCARVSVRWSSP